MENGHVEGERKEKRKKEDQADSSSDGEAETSPPPPSKKSRSTKGPLALAPPDTLPDLPDSLMRPLVQLVHHNLGKIDEVVNEACTVFRNYFVDEAVLVTVGSEQREATVVEVLPQNRYRLQPASGESFISEDEAIRRKSPISKSYLKKKIRAITSKEFVGGPFCVAQRYVDRFKLSNTYAPAVQTVVDSLVQKRKGAKPTSAPASKRAKTSKDDESPTTTLSESTATSGKTKKPRKPKEVGSENGESDSKAEPPVLLPDLPDELMAKFCALVQHAVAKVGDVVDSVFNYFQAHYFVGERVVVFKTSKSVTVTITAIDGADTDTPQYHVVLDDQQPFVTPTVFKRKTPITKSYILTKIRSLASRDTFPGAPFIVHDSYVEKFGLPTSLPPHVQAVVDAAMQKRANAAPKDPAERDAWVQRRRDERSRQRIDTHEQAPPPPKPKYPMEDSLITDRSEEHSRLPEAENDLLLPQECRGDCIMVWDFARTFSKVLQLSPFNLSDFSHAIIHPFPVPLLVWLHVTLLREVLRDELKTTHDARLQNAYKRLSPDDWQSVLLDVLVCWTRVGADETAEELIYKPVGIDMELVTAVLARESYGDLPVEDRLTILRFLCDEALDTRRFRKHLDKCVDQLAELRREKYHTALEMADHRKKLREVEEKLEEGTAEQPAAADDCRTARQKTLSTTQEMRELQQKKDRMQRKIAKSEGQKQKRIDGFKLKLAEVAVRTGPLGMDRDRNRYWFFPQGDWRVFIENNNGTEWRCYDTSQKVDSLIEYLDIRGVREKALRSNLEIRLPKINKNMRRHAEFVAKQTMPSRTTRSSGPAVSLDPDAGWLGYINQWDGKKLDDAKPAGPGRPKKNR